MLYYNCPLIEVLTWLWQDTRSPLYETRLRETVGWVFREMIADRDGSGDTPSGAFASSLDADSEGEEGKFYVWTEPEIDGLLGDDAALFKAHYDVRPPGNWEGKSIRSEEHTSELQSLMRISYAVFCLKKKKNNNNKQPNT